MSKRILMILSEWGYWGEELVGPLEVFDEKGYDVDFATPTGKRPVAISVSMDPSYIDPPLGRSVTSEEMGEKVREIDTSPRLDNPINLTTARPRSCASRRRTTRSSTGSARSWSRSTTRS